MATYSKGKKGQEDEEEVSIHWMNIKKREDTGN
jgi:hypothetical protein